jgi:long-chain acyl-CoA synthetase
MARRTLIDFFDDLSRLDGQFLVYDDGYRTWSFSYAETAARAHAFAATLHAAGIVKGQHVVIWSENRPEWIIALWGCLLQGVVLVPIDYRASSDFLHKVAGIVDARVILVGDTVPELPASGTFPVWRLSSAAEESTAAVPPAPGLTPDDVAEIIFTSGATAEPKGVVLTHRNILANIVPIEREIAKYRKYARPFLPLRFLNLLPLSHMFGQAMATFVPPLLAGVVIFTRTFAPEEVIDQIRSRRVSVLVSVPKILEVLREQVRRMLPETATEAPEGAHWMMRWWKYRRAHRMFGLKFWAMVVGAAPLDPDVEAFWGRLGFLVVQGYGLTETAPIVTLNHPFHASRGAVGRPIAGVEVRIADDGEILVRGENVTRGYYNAPEETRAAFHDGWFHTGDIGTIDEQGRLHIRGRKKEMIVTPEGLNVFPEDVERVLNEQPGVRESAVVGARAPGSTAERVQAIVVLEQGADLDEIVRTANARLQDHQKIRAAAAWPGNELPRTEGTKKLKRRELHDWLMAAAGDRQARIPSRASERSVVAVLERFAPGRTLTPDTTIDELGLSSLERVELMIALEEALQVTIDEGQFAAARTVRDLETITRPLEAGYEGPVVRTAAPSAAEPVEFPSWNRSAAARLLRRISLPTWILPFARVFASLEIEGLDHLRDVEGPAIFAANHQSHLDTPAILMALPARWRYRVAPAMAKEFFTPHFHPEQYGRKAVLTNRLNYYLASLFFNAFPLPQREAGTRQTLRYIGELATAGYSVLIFPEGRRTDTGEIARFQPGIGMIGARLHVPVIPVRLDGLDRILHHTWKFPQRGTARVAFGRPIWLTGGDYAALAAQVEEAVRRL